jgi:hypothetical protein
MPDWQADGLIEDYAHYRRGEASDISPTVEEATGQSPHTFSEFARDHKAAFLKTEKSEDEALSLEPQTARGRASL